MQTEVRIYTLASAFYPVVLLGMTFVPVANLFLFSLHGGLGWILMFLSGPFTVITLVFGIFFRKPPRASLTEVSCYLICYVGATFVLGMLATNSLQETLGVRFQNNAVWAALNIPWSLALGSPFAFR